MKKKDPRLVKIVDWLNKATANELTWIQLIRMWYYRNFLDELRNLQSSQWAFLDFCKEVCETGDTAELFNDFTSVPGELSEDEKRERQEKLKDWIDPSTDKPYVEPQEPVGPFLDERGVLHNLPALSERSREKIAKILPVFVELWEERIREKSKRPLLRQCPVCDTYFVPSKKSQKFCQTTAIDRPINPRTGKPRPPCRIVAYQRTPEYKEKTAHKMADWRANKAKEQLADAPSSEPIKTPRGHRRQ